MYKNHIAGFLSRKLPWKSVFWCLWACVSGLYVRHNLYCFHLCWFIM